MSDRGSPRDVLSRLARLCDRLGLKEEQSALGWVLDGMLPPELSHLLDRRPCDDERMAKLVRWIEKRGGDARPRDLIMSRLAATTDEASAMLAALAVAGLGSFLQEPSKDSKRQVWAFRLPRLQEGKE
jgi:hypothetical protein